MKKYHVFLHVTHSLWPKERGSVGFLYNQRFTLTKVVLSSCLDYSILLSIPWPNLPNDKSV